MKTNIYLNLANAIIFAGTGFLWIYHGNRGEIVAGVMFFIAAFCFLISFLGKKMKMDLEKVEKKARMLKDENPFQNFDNDYDTYGNE